MKKKSFRDEVGDHRGGEEIVGYKLALSTCGCDFQERQEMPQEDEGFQRYEEREKIFQGRMLKKEEESRRIGTDVFSRDRREMGNVGVERYRRVQ